MRHLFAHTPAHHPRRAQSHALTSAARGTHLAVCMLGMALWLSGCNKTDPATPAATPASPTAPPPTAPALAQPAAQPVAPPAAPQAAAPVAASAPEAAPAAAPTATPAAAPAATAAAPATGAPASAASPSALTLNCTPTATAEVGQYMTENNTWGSKGALGWSQCMGGAVHPQGGMTAQWTWDWQQQGDNVKAYPEVVFGHKPGYPKSTTTLLPRKLNTLHNIMVDYSVQTEREGAGNLAIDMWLTNVANPTTFAVPPITHEVMIWLEVFGPMYAGGQQVDRVRIHGTQYRVFLEEKSGQGWRYIAFAPNSPMQTTARMDLMPFFVYLRSKGLITTEEFLAAVNFGNELISGAGDTRLNRFAVTVN